MKEKVFVSKLQFVAPRRIPLYGEKDVFVSRKRTIFSRNGNGFNFPENFSVGEEIKKGGFYQVSVSTFFPERIKVFFISEGRLTILNPLFFLKFKDKRGKERRSSRFIFCRTTPAKGAIGGYIADTIGNGMRSINIFHLGVAFSGEEAIFQEERIYSSLISSSGMPPLPNEISLFENKMREMIRT